MQLDPGIKMLSNPSNKVYLYGCSLTTLEDNGFDIEDDRDLSAMVLGEHQKDWYLTKLTNRQKQVAQKIYDGYTRRETACDLHVSLQAVHQIILRMRRRIVVKTGLKL